VYGCRAVCVHRLAILLPDPCHKIITVINK
jgi:hypothetical protein